MQWLFDIIEEIMEAAGFLKTSYVDRGTYVGADWNQNDFTFDNTWRELDLSAIVPAGAKAVCLRLRFGCDDISWRIRLRPKGTTSHLHTCVQGTQIANVTIGANPCLGCDADRKIEYRSTPTTNLEFFVNVRGWFL